MKQHEVVMTKAVMSKAVMTRAVMTRAEGMPTPPLLSHLQLQQPYKQNEGAHCSSRMAPESRLMLLAIQYKSVTAS